MQDIVALKEQVIELVKMKGPVLPVQISTEIKVDTMFVGAIFSELMAEKKLKITRAKIGGSPLYYVDGQESKLDKLYEFLPGKEKEAYNLLKKNRVLFDTEQEPSIRVALRNLEDFAKPVDKKGHIFWRWYLLSESEADFLIDKVKPKIEPKKLDVQKKIVEPKKIEIKEKPVKKIEKKIDGFLEEIKAYLENKEVKILEEHIVRKNSDVEMRIKFPSNFGDLEFFLKAKNKKRIGDNDLILAHSKGQKHKIPTLFLSNGGLTKKAEKYINENLKGYLIFRNLEA